MAFNYLNARRKMFKSLADHCHDKALEASFPDVAAKWIALMDSLLWCCTEEGDTSTFPTMFDASAQPGDPT